MIDSIIIENCADPSLYPPLVKPFLERVGAKNPFDLAIVENTKFVLQRSESSEEAKRHIQNLLGKTALRFGPTAYPIGIGAKNLEDVDYNFLEPCQNIRLGTALFAQVISKVSFSLKTRSLEDAFKPAFNAYISENIYRLLNKDFPHKDFTKTERRLASIQKLAPEDDSGKKESTLDPRMADISIDLSAIKGKKRSEA
jgi:hypothetical protein